MSVQFTDNSKEVKTDMQRAILKALTEVGLFGEGEAKEIVPVDTGNLKNSLTYQVNEGEKNVDIGSVVEYAPFVEFKKPYLRPAILDNENTIKNIIQDNLENA